MKENSVTNESGIVNVGYISDGRLSISNSILVLKPLPNHAEIIKDVNERYFSDRGFCFPCIAKAKYKTDVVDGELVEIKIADIPPYQPELYRFPPTHSFKLLADGSSEKLNAFTLNPTFFLLQVIGYVRGFRVMPEAFWFDGKIPTKASNNVICTDYDSVITRALNVWKASSDEARKDLIGIFYFFNRSPSYHWPFERFSHDFMVFDSAMRFYSKHVLKREYAKKKKYEDFLAAARLKFSVQELITLADKRNDLFHEIKWGEGAPGLFDDSNMFEMTFKFRRFLHAVLGRSLGLEGTYFDNVDWADRGTYLFDAR